MKENRANCKVKCDGDLEGKQDTGHFRSSDEIYVHVQCKMIVNVGDEEKLVSFDAVHC